MKKPLGITLRVSTLPPGFDDLYARLMRQHFERVDPRPEVQPMQRPIVAGPIGLPFELGARGGVALGAGPPWEPPASSIDLRRRTLRRAYPVHPIEANVEAAADG